MRPETQLLIKASEMYRQSEPNDLVNYNMRLALHIAADYRQNALKHGIAWEDVQGEALLTLVTAAEGYPDSKAAENDVPFKAYLDRALRYRFVDLFRKSSIAHLPANHVRKKILTLNATAAELARKQEKGRIGEQELATALKWPIEKVRRYRRYARAVSNYYSLDEPVYEDSNRLDTFKDTIQNEDDMEEETLNRVAVEQEKEWLSKATVELPPMARAAVILNFGLNPPEEIPAPKIEDVIGLSLGPYNTGNGIRRLRELRRDEKNDMPEEVQKGKGVPWAGRRAGSDPKSQETRDRAKDFWRRATSERWFPGLQADEPARKVGT